jgi:integrase
MILTSRGMPRAGRNGLFDSLGRIKKYIAIKIQKDIDSGIKAEAATLSLAQYLTRRLEQIKPTVEPATHGGYERHARLHIAPHLGSVRLARIGKTHVRSLYATLSSAGVSTAIQRKIGSTLTIALNAAVNDDLIPTNPAAKVKKPKAPRHEMTPLDPQQAALFLKEARSHRMFAYFQTAIDSGCRPSELLALEWDDVNLDEGYLTVTKSLEDLAGVLRVKATKTAKSRRRVDLSPATVAALLSHKAAMLREGFLDRPVFCNTLGHHQRVSLLRRDSFLPILKRAGLPHIRLYDLRHTMASLLLLADVNVKIVSEQLGHTDASLTMNVYQHLLPGMGRKAADVMGRLLAVGGRDT